VPTGSLPTEATLATVLVAPSITERLFAGAPVGENKAAIRLTEVITVPCIEKPSGA